MAVSVFENELSSIQEVKDDCSLDKEIIDPLNSIVTDNNSEDIALFWGWNYRSIFRQKYLGAPGSKPYFNLPATATQGW